MKTPYIIDTTLRDGEQAPGIVFSMHEKIVIASLLEKLGIDEMEVGTPAIDKYEENDIKHLIDIGFKYKTTVWSRANIDDIKKCIHTGADYINISFPTSSIQLNTLGKNEQWALKNLALVKYAKDYFDKVFIGCQDASRTNHEFLSYFIVEGAKMGASRARIADTTGILSPLTTQALFNYLTSSSLGIPLEFHGHNDFGMATANSLVAYVSGADAISLTINGIGERAGNASLEEFIMAVKHTHGVNIDEYINTKYLYLLSRYVAKASNRPLPLSKPITGSMVNKHESGIHVNSLIKKGSSYESYDPCDAGMNEKEFILGKHSGKASIKHLMEKKGVYLTDSNAEYILGIIKALSRQRKSAISCDEIALILSSTRQFSEFSTTINTNYTN